MNLIYNFFRFAVALRYNHAPSRRSLTSVLVIGFRHLKEENVHHLESVANVSEYFRDIGIAPHIEHPR